jgi:hypothetical protein
MNAKTRIWHPMSRKTSARFFLAPENLQQPWTVGKDGCKEWKAHSAYRPGERCERIECDGQKASRNITAELFSSSYQISLFGASPKRISVFRYRYRLDFFSLDVFENFSQGRRASQHNTSNMSAALETEAPVAQGPAPVKGMKKNGLQSPTHPSTLQGLIAFAGKQWHDNKTAFRPRTNQTSWDKRTAERKALAANKAKEKELKDEKEELRKVGASTCPRRNYS